MCLSNVGSFQNQNHLATRAIIEDNGLAQELLFEQFITDIVVDGATNGLELLIQGFYGIARWTQKPTKQFARHQVMY
jgi:hypothetical protein